jgi:hypothetical protein
VRSEGWGDRYTEYWFPVNSLFLAKSKEERVGTIVPQSSLMVPTMSLIRV